MEMSMSEVKILLQLNAMTKKRSFCFVCLQILCVPAAISSLYHDDPLTSVRRLIAAFMLNCGVSPVIGNGDYH